MATPESALIDVKGMTCQHCVQNVRNTLATTPGVQDVQVNLQPGQARVQYDPDATSIAKLMHAINATGFQATGFTRAPTA